MSETRLYYMGNGWSLYSRQDLLPEQRASALPPNSRTLELFQRMLRDARNHSSISFFMARELNWGGMRTATEKQIAERLNLCLKQGSFFLLPKPNFPTYKSPGKAQPIPEAEPEMEPWVETEPMPVAEAPEASYSMPHEAAMAQAKTLRKASESGIPFCAECAGAALV